jgi:hypothetical protein
MGFASWLLGYWCRSGLVCTYGKFSSKSGQSAEKLMWPHTTKRGPPSGMFSKREPFSVREANPLWFTDGGFSIVNLEMKKLIVQDIISY